MSVSECCSCLTQVYLKLMSDPKLEHAVKEAGWQVEQRRKAEATEALLDPDDIEVLEWELIGNDGTVYTISKPRVPKGIKDEALKKAMYQAQVDGNGNFVPGPRTKFEADKLAQQTECKHPFADLRWGSNKTAMYAKCTKCGAKSVVCWRQMSKEPETLRQNPVITELIPEHIRARPYAETSTGRVVQSLRTSRSITTR